MKCPRCSEAMETTQFHEVQIDRCTKCGGLWFDEFELDELRAEKGSEKIDTGSADEANQSSQRQLKCPRCNTLMLKMVDIKHAHIWYETCEVCGGSFLDAGEFKDMKRHNLLEGIKDLLVEMKGGRSIGKVKLSPAILRRIIQ